MTALEAYRQSEDVVALRDELGKLERALLEDPVLENHVRTATGIVNFAGEVSRAMTLLHSYRVVLLNAMQETTLKGRLEQ